ncbi:MAG: aminotransferase class I/II-fold pyridoxal phosphate-dependent enzyme [Pseudomonadota bacterium]
MDLEEFRLERIQSLYENEVEYNLSDSGVHPYKLGELLSASELEYLQGIELGYGYTNGTPALRSAIANLYRDRTEEHVVVTNGSAEANLILVLSQLSAGDEIIVVVPNYLQIWGFAKALGVTVKEVSLSPQDWSLDVTALAQAVTPNTRMVTLCNPNNPTGALLSRAEQDELIRLCDQQDLILHVDEIYRGSELDQEEPPSFADLSPRVFVSAGMSKSLALPGLRVGWLMGPKADVYSAWSAKDYTSITTSSMSEYISTLVLEPTRRQQVLDRSKAILRENRTYLTQWIEQRAWCNYTPPKAGGMGFIQYDLPVAADPLTDTLRNDHSVLTLSGTVFGLDGYIRLGIGSPNDHVRAGLDALEVCVQKYLET